LVPEADGKAVPEAGDTDVPLSAGPVQQHVATRMTGIRKRIPGTGFIG
jgi:hypothetical protein